MKLGKNQLAILNILKQNYDNWMSSRVLKHITKLEKSNFRFSMRILLRNGLVDWKIDTSEHTQMKWWRLKNENISLGSGDSHIGAETTDRN